MIDNTLSACELAHHSVSQSSPGHISQLAVLLLMQNYTAQIRRVMSPAWRRKFNYHLPYGVFTHALRWDGMAWAALVTQCIPMEAFAH